MKFNLLLFFLLTFTIVKEGQGQTAFDTVETTHVGTGVIYRRIIAPAVPWSINMLEIDLTDTNNFFETVKAQNKIEGYETVSSMAKRSSYLGHTVIGAVNGDFYDLSNGAPTNMQVSKGEIVKGTNGKPVIGFNVYNMPFINNVSYNGEMIKNDSIVSISGINTNRGANQLILYNHFYGTTTGTNNSGTEISIKAIGPWLLNDTVRCVVINKENNIGNLTITDSTAVLSGQGSSQVFLDSLVNIGDTLELINKLTPSIPKLKELVGGNPKVVINGSNNGDNVSREPRTSIGISKDTTKLFIFTVDGRQNGFSVGMTLSELADFMIANGVYTGLNLDGGGSTTMVLRDSVVNSPSAGGSEREVSNSLLFLTDAGNGSLNTVQVSPDYFKVYDGQIVHFKLRGFDEFYNIIQINPADIHYSLSHSFGTITSDGIFTAGNAVDTGYVFAEYNGLKDSAKIIVKGISLIAISPKNIVTDTMRIQVFKMRAFDSENIERNILLNQYNWSLSDSSVGSIDSVGNFKGISPGSTFVIASYLGLTDSALINIVIRHGNLLIDSLENLKNWNFSFENLNSSGSSLSISNTDFSQGMGSFKIDYAFTYDKSKLNYIYLNTNYLLEGVPDSIIVDAKSDGQKHVINFIIEDDNQEQFNIPVRKYFDVSDHFDNMGGALKDASQIISGSSLNYPVTLKQIVIKLARETQEGQVYSGTLYFDNLRVSYPDSTITSIADVNNLPSQFSLSQNYPNPFNPSTTIKFTIKKEGFVSLKIYDILGREVATLVNEKLHAGQHIVKWNAASGSRRFASGIYIYRLQQESKNLSRKMIFLK